jgi:hypothetical protein
MRPWIFVLAFSSCLQAGDRAPMTVNFQDSASYRWFNKKVQESRLLDDMESLAAWTAFTNDPGGVVDARVSAQVSRAKQAVAEMTLTAERSRSGRSLRLRMPTKADRSSIHDFFVFLQDKSGSSDVHTEEFRECDVPET